MHARLYIGQMILLFYRANGSEISLMSASGRVALFFHSATAQTHLHQNSEDSQGGYNGQDLNHKTYDIWSVESGSSA